jgi:hypothetical protein
MVIVMGGDDEGIQVIDVESVEGRMMRVKRRGEMLKVEED